ncbi:hypothetical protein ACXN5S_12250 [Pseudoroseicyclus sp. H15]
MFPPIPTLPAGVSRADVYPTQERRHVRRSAPERLQFEPQIPGAPVVPLLPLVDLPAPEPAKPRRQGWLLRFWRGPAFAPQI